MNTSNNDNIGVKNAIVAAQAVNAKLVIPQFKNLSTKPTDFNDLMCLEGADEVRRQLANAKEVEPTIPNDEKAKKPSQATLIMDLTKDLEFFHDKQNVTYATIENNGHKETWRLSSQDFQNWLSHHFWKIHQKAISKNVLQDTLGILHGKASFDGNCHEVYTRIATVDGVIYINLANENWEVIQVTKDSWEVLKDSPVKFTRVINMQPLPVPLNRGNIDNLWQYLNIPKKYRKLVLAFILECFRPNTPFPILVLYGTQGSAKSTTQEIIRMFIDPSTCNLRTAPKKSEDLLVAAANNWIVSFNNVSHLSSVQQDDLCSVATGGALSTRELYTTHQEASVNIKRPVIINGIGDLVTAQDLIDRCIILELPEIKPKDRKTEEQIMLDFSKEYAAIFGALLDILVKTLQELPNVKLLNKPRMADFALLGTALEKVMNWEQGSFMDDYTYNRTESMAGALEHSSVAVALTHLIEDDYCHSFSGSYNALYTRLSGKYKPDMAGWVKSAKGLANQIKRQKPALRAIGIEITLDNQRHKDGFHVHIKRIENNVHQVHQVHQPTIDEDCQGELTGEHAKDNFLSTPQVHHETPH